MCTVSRKEREREKKIGVRWKMRNMSIKIKRTKLRRRESTAWYFKKDVKTQASRDPKYQLMPLSIQGVRPMVFRQLAKPQNSSIPHLEKQSKSIYWEERKKIIELVQPIKKIPQKCNIFYTNRVQWSEVKHKNLPWNTIKVDKDKSKNAAVNSQKIHTFIKTSNNAFFMQKY